MTSWLTLEERQTVSKFSSLTLKGTRGVQNKIKCLLSLLKGICLPTAWYVDHATVTQRNYRAK